LKAAFFEYVRPADVEEALGLKEGHDDRSIFLAGGQSAIPALNMRLNQPNLVIDIGRIEALQGIWAEDGGIRVGALVTHRELGESKIAREYSTIFRDASKLIAHEAIRNKGTIGGSLALADPAAEWPAVCVALNARIRLRSRTGVRELDSNAFFKGTYATERLENELLESIYFPKQTKGFRSEILEFARQHGGFAAAGVVFAVDTAAGVGRSVFFAISQAPIVIAQAAIMEFLTSNFENTRAAGERWYKDQLNGFKLTADLYHDGATKGHIAAVLASRVLVTLKESLRVERHS